MGRPRKYPLTMTETTEGKEDMQAETIEKPVKKGNASWAPANLTKVKGLDPNYSYRWVAKTPDRIGKHIDEEWEFLNGVSPDKVTLDGKTRIYESNGLTSVHEKHDMVLMRLPKEKAQARAEFYNQRTADVTQGLKREAETEAGAGFHGDIKIAGRTATTTID